MEMCSTGFEAIEGLVDEHPFAFVLTKFLSSYHIYFFLGFAIEEGIANIPNTDLQAI